MDTYNRSKDPYFNSAPEVASPSLPERANQDYEGPQPVQYTDQDGTIRAYYGSGAVLDEKSGAPKSSKRILIFSILGALVALAIGIGIGVGIGISVEKNNNQGLPSGVKKGSSTRSLTGSPTSSGSATPSGSASPSLAAPGALATGSTSGLAAYSCTNGTELRSSSSVAYISDCNAAYLTGGPDLYNTGTVIANVSEPPYTRYNLLDCLDLCDRWNIYPDHNDTPCRTVTYYANLTQAYGDDWMGNCFLKSGRPADIARSGDDGIDWEHTVSAYMSCLVNGGC